MSTKRRVLTLKEKIDILEVYDKDKLSVRELSKRFQIGKTQAADIVKRKTELVSYWNSNVNSAMKRSFLKPMGSSIDKICYDWFVNARAKGLPCSGSTIRAKAKEIAEGLGYVDFCASSGWLEKFRKRHNIVFRAVPEEARTVIPQEVPSLPKDDLPNIFNANETGLFFHASPNKTLTIRGEKCVGGKLYVNLYSLSEIWRNAQAMGFNNIDLEKFVIIDTNLIMDDDNVLPVNCEVPAESVYVTGESDEEIDIGNQTNSVDNYKQAISVVKELQEFVKNRGDSKAMEMLSNLELHFQNCMVKTTTP